MVCHSSGAIFDWHVLTRFHHHETPLLPLIEIPLNPLNSSDRSTDVPLSPLSVSPGVSSQSRSPLSPSLSPPETETDRTPYSHESAPTFRTPLWSIVYKNNIKYSTLAFPIDPGYAKRFVKCRYSSDLDVSMFNNGVKSLLLRSSPFHSLNGFPRLNASRVQVQVTTT